MAPSISPDEGGSSTEKRFNIDRKLVISIVIFSVTGFLLMILINIASSTMSSLRSYTSLQAEWTREWKEARFNLHEYIDDPKTVHYKQIQKSFDFIRNTTNIRVELEKPSPDYQLVRNSLQSVGTHQLDIDGMIRTYRWLHELKYFNDIVIAWENIDSLAYRMEGITDSLHHAFASGGELSGEKQQELKQRIEGIDRAMVGQHEEMHDLLGMGMRLLKSVTFWSSTGVGVLLLIIGITFSFRFRNSIKEWRRSLIHSQKRYSSLFNYNPNAIYSINAQGEFTSGNEALEQLTGYPMEELESMEFTPLVHPDEKERVGNFFAKALNGEPQSYETKGIRKDGKVIDVHVTNLPIYVDGEIEGVYGIAQDITDRKEAERKLRRSLEEKKTLLAEIHHRVKNNLAVISGLIDLQADSVSSEAARSDLMNTQSRIHSMAIVHEKLYQSESLSNINMQGYIKDLANSIRETVKDREKDVELNFNLDPIYLDITQAIPCGLLLNELLVNAYKYAFEQRKHGIIDIDMSSSDGVVTLEISDNGIGIPEEYEINESNSLGMNLVKTLTKQLDGKLNVETDDGTTFTVEFKHKLKGFLQISETESLS